MLCGTREAIVLSGDRSTRLTEDHSVIQATICLDNRSQEQWIPLFISSNLFLTDKSLGLFRRACSKSDPNGLPSDDPPSYLQRGGSKSGLHEPAPRQIGKDTVFRQLSRLCVRFCPRAEGRI